MPVEKFPGDLVYAGTINQSGALEIGAQKLGRDTSFGKIVDAVEDLDTQHKAEKVSCYDCWRYLPPDEQVGAAVVLFNSAGVEMAGTLFCRACASRYGTPADFFAVFGEADPATFLAEVKQHAAAFGGDPA